MNDFLSKVVVYTTSKWDLFKFTVKFMAALHGESGNYCNNLQNILETLRGEREHTGFMETGYVDGYNVEQSKLSHQWGLMMYVNTANVQPAFFSAALVDAAREITGVNFDYDYIGDDASSAYVNTDGRGQWFREAVYVQIQATTGDWTDYVFSIDEEDAFYTLLRVTTGKTYSNEAEVRKDEEFLEENRVFVHFYERA